MRTTPSAGVVDYVSRGGIRMTVLARHCETEKEFSQAVVDLATLSGWTVFRTWRSDHSPAGEPDLRLVHPIKKKMLWRELKVGKNMLSPLQRAAHEILCEAGEDLAVWRPTDWDRIVEELS